MLKELSHFTLLMSPAIIARGLREEDQREAQFACERVPTVVAIDKTQSNECGHLIFSRHAICQLGAQLVGLRAASLLGTSIQVSGLTMRRVKEKRNSR